METTLGCTTTSYGAWRLEQRQKLLLALGLQGPDAEYVSLAAAEQGMSLASFCRQAVLEAAHR